MSTASEGLTQESIFIYLEKAAWADVPTDTVVDVIRLWTQHDTSSEDIQHALEQLETRPLPMDPRVRRYVAAIRDLLAGRPGVIDLDLPSQRAAETDGLPEAPSR